MINLVEVSVKIVLKHEFTDSVQVFRVCFSVLIRENTKERDKKYQLFESGPVIMKVSKIWIQVRFAIHLFPSVSNWFNIQSSTLCIIRGRHFDEAVKTLAGRKFTVSEF